METFAALANGMAVAVQPMNLLYALIGVFLGTAAVSYTHLTLPTNREV